MENYFYTIKNNSEGFYEERFSKFIAKSFYVETEQEAQQILDKAKKDYRDARHVTYAYKIGSILKYSDDGEPQGTAGTPIMRIIEANELDNILIIVIRYFGGILLGTGPLARAYMQSAKNLVEKSKITRVEKAMFLTFKVEYKDFDYVKIIVNRNNGVISSSTFLENIEVIAKIPLEKLENAKKELQEKYLNIEFYNQKECYL